MPPAPSAHPPVERFFDKLPVMACVASDGYLTRVNHRWADVLGWSEDDLLARPLLEFVHPGDREATTEAIGRALAGEFVDGTRNRVLRADGSWVVVEWSGQGDGDAVYAAGREVAAATVLGERFFETTRLLACTGAGDRFTRVNPRWTEVLGWSEEELLSRPFTDFVHPDDLASTADTITQLEGGDAVVESRNRFRRVDGSWALLEWNGVADMRSGVSYGLAREVSLVAELGERFFESTLSMACLASGDSLTRVNRRWTEVLGWSEQELLGRPFLEFVHPDDHAATIEAIGQLFRGESVVRFRNRYRRADGSWAMLEWDSVADVDAGVIYGSCRDVTAEVAEHAIVLGVDLVLQAESFEGAAWEARSVLARLDPGCSASVYAVAQDGGGDLALLTGAPGSPRAVAPADCRALQLEGLHTWQRTGTGTPCAHFDPDRFAITVCAPIEATGRPFGLFVVTRGGEATDPGGDARRRGVLADAADRVASALAQVALRDHLVGRALVDDLTQLPNRSAFLQAVDGRLRLIDAGAPPFGVLIVDVDDFKAINDAHGHHAGDTALQALAAVLRTSIRSRDVAARLGGDEFAVLVDTDDRRAVEGTAMRIIERAGQAAPIDGVALSLSVGGAMVGPAASGWAEVYQAADRAMYDAKRAGGARLVMGPVVGARLPTPR